MADETILIEVEYDTTEAQSEIDELTRSIEGLKVEQSKLDKQLKEGQISQVEYSKQSAKLKTQLQAETKSRKDAIKVINATTGSYEKLQAQTNKLIAQSKALDRTTEAGEKRFQSLTKKINKNTDALKKMDAAQGRSNRNVGNYKSALKGVGSSLGVVTGGVALLGAAITKGIQVTKQAIEVNREFEKTFSNVLTLLDEAQKAEFEIELRQGAVDVMANYGLEIADVNKALFDTISAGVPAGEAIDFLDKSARLAIAGNAELSSVVDGATNVIGAYGEAAGSTNDILNAFFAAQVKGKTDVGLLATNIGKVASTAAAADIPLNELFGTFAGLTKFIGGTEESATSLAATMNAIIKPSKEAEEAFKELGIETGITGLKNNGLLNTIKQVAGAYEGNNDVLVELIPNQRALKAVAGLSSEAIAEIEQNVLDLNDAETASILVQEAFNEQMSTSQKKAEQLSGNWKRLLITIGGGESIFKKIGNGIKAELNDEITKVTKNIETFKIVWQRLTGELTKEEAIEATAELEKRFSGISEESDNATVSIDELNTVIEENTVVTTQNTEAAESNVVSISSLKEQVKELEKAKNELNISDEWGIKVKSQEIEKIKEQISSIESLGKAEAEKKEQDLISDQELREIELGIQKEFSADTIDIATQEAEELERLNTDMESAKTAATEAGQAKRRDIVKQSLSAIQDITGSATQFLIDQNNQKLNAELIAAGDNEEKKAAIERKYAKRNQKLAIRQAIVKGSLVVLNALASVPFIPTGLIAAGVAATATGFQIATIRNQKFEKGGQVPIAKRGATFGTFTGPSHAGGGVDLYTGTGQHVANVEGKENFYVINKDASAYINSLSDINQRIGGGVPLSSKRGRMQEGGQADIPTENAPNMNDITENVIRSLPPIVVQTVDIKTGLEDRQDVLQVGVV